VGVVLYALGCRVLRHQRPRRRSPRDRARSDDRRATGGIAGERGHHRGRPADRGVADHYRADRDPSLGSGDGLGTGGAQRACRCAVPPAVSMIPKSGYRFSEKIMLKQRSYFETTARGGGGRGGGGTSGLGTATMKFGGGSTSMLSVVRVCR